MKNKNNRVIFRVKDGVTPAEVLPMQPFGAEAINVSRLYDIDQEVANFTGNVPMGVDADNKEEVFESVIYETKPEEEKRLFRTFVAEGTPESTESLLENLENNPNVEYAQIDEMNKIASAPQPDPLLPQVWGLHKAQFPAAWNITQGDEIVVAVIDTGVDYNHPDIAGNMWRDSAGNCGRDFSDGDYDPLDYQGHGTHCAGTIAATVNNGIGIAGVAPRAKIMALKIFPNALDSVCAAAIKYAADNGAKVLSNSWGPVGHRPSNPAVEDAVVYANSKGCIVVFAAGNDDDDVQHYSPANQPTVVSVAATDVNDARAGFSNFGTSITIAAPGVDILSLKRNTSTYRTLSGTSMACPHVAGLVALVLSSKGPMSLAAMKQQIRNNADAIATDKPISGLRINAAKSV